MVDILEYNMQGNTYTYTRWHTRDMSKIHCVPHGMEERQTGLVVMFRVSQARGPMDILDRVGWFALIRIYKQQIGTVSLSS